MPNPAGTLVVHRPRRRYLVPVALTVGLLMPTGVADAAPSTTSRVSLASDGVQGTSASFSPTISGDGRYVAFVSSAPNLVSGDTNGRPDVFVRDRVGGTTERVNVTSDGTQTSASLIGRVAVSGDGRYVAFTSNATTL
jgi:Tol biopolymer transport system component